MSSNTKREEIIKRLKEAGIKVTEGEKILKDGKFSGIIGRSGSVITINLPSN